ncbi:MAG TPA: DUF4342 domain-containing protein [Chloroflexia bacterium]
MNGNESNGNQSNEAHNQGGTSTGSTATAGGTRTEEFKLSGDDIMGKVREIIEEGNARRIILRNAEGHNLIEIPLTVGLVGAALLPVYAALGAAVALAVNLTIVVEKRA